jgi:hypothetical protein
MIDNSGRSIEGRGNLCKEATQYCGSLLYNLEQFSIEARMRVISNIPSLISKEDNSKIHVSILE